MYIEAINISSFNKPYFNGNMRIIFIFIFILLIDKILHYNIEIEARINDTEFKLTTFDKRFQLNSHHMINAGIVIYLMHRL